MIATKKFPVEQKAGDPLGERTIAPHGAGFEQQLAGARQLGAVKHDSSSAWLPQHDAHGIEQVDRQPEPV